MNKYLLKSAAILGLKTGIKDMIKNPSLVTKKPAGTLLPKAKPPTTPTL